MIPAHFKTLIDKLIEKTDKKEAVWAKTSRDDEFKLNLEKGAVTTDNWNNSDKNGNWVDIAVINDQGDTIDRINFTETSDSEDYLYLMQLHTRAKRAYFRVDETFNHIFEELDSKKTIGKDERGQAL